MAKRIIAGIFALAMVFGTAGSIPKTVMSFSGVMTAEAEEELPPEEPPAPDTPGSTTVLPFAFEYRKLEDNTYEILKYTNNKKFSKIFYEKLI